VSDRVAIVVGAGGFLGRTVASKLAADGFNVVGVDRSEEGLRELPDRTLVGDASDPAVAKALIDRIVADVGPPAVLVNILGAFTMGDALAATPEDLRLMIDVNAGAALWLTQAVAPHMEHAGSGSIVHISARPGLEPTSGMAAYSLGKAALTHLIRVLDLELRPKGIRVNAVAPQLIDNPKNRAYFPAEVMAHSVTPEAITQVIAFLAGDASAPVSGAILPTYGA
jgi:NAD(P)-dependent dehydrogenase (short-subunit alcohol dehydrogenase family)